MKVVAFNGSARRDGNTADMLNRVLSGLEAEGIDTELIQLAGKKAQGCTACNKCREFKDMRCHGRDDYINGCIAKMFEADGVLIGSPVYYSDITPETMALIDRAGYVSGANGGALARKVGAAVIAVRRAGGIHAFDSINHLFLISQMIVPGSSYWNIGYGREKGEVLADEEGMRTMDNLAINMAWLMKKIAD